MKPLNLNKNIVFSHKYLTVHTTIFLQIKDDSRHKTQKKTNKIHMSVVKISKQQLLVIAKIVSIAVM